MAIFRIGDHPHGRYELEGLHAKIIIPGHHRKYQSSDLVIPFKYFCLLVKKIEYILYIIFHNLTFPVNSGIPFNIIAIISALQNVVKKPISQD